MFFFFFFLHIGYNLCNQFYYKYHGFTKVRVARPWLMCGYHGLSIVTKYIFFGFICIKPWFRKYDLMTS